MMKTLLLLLLAWGAISCLGKVVELTNNNFEHDTQAATGATTGDWFVKFYAPWCGHCKKMAPAWEKLGDALEGEINVAKVDGSQTQQQELLKRFEIKGFPTLIYFQRGRMFRYKGGRDFESLQTFVQSMIEEGAPPDGSKGDPVPKPANPVLSELFDGDDRTMFAILGVGVVAVLSVLFRLLGGSSKKGKAQ